MPEQPEFFRQALTNIAGTNLYNEPKLQVRWAPYFRDHLGNPKYLNPLKGGTFECWILTRWAPPEFFGSPESWNVDRFIYDDVHQIEVDQKGDYPSRGDFVMVCPLSNDGEYLELSESVLIAIRQKLKADEEFALMNQMQRNEFIVKQEQEKEAKIEAGRIEADGERDDYYKTNWGKINRKQGAAQVIVPSNYEHSSN